MTVDIFNTDKKYDIIYTDPPWQQGKGGKKKKSPNSSGGALDYPTMPLEDIKKIHEDVLPLCNEKHNIFMWTIDKYLVEAQQMMESLGYTLHARITWDKVTGIQTAFTVRYTAEYLLWFYKKGNMLMVDKDTRGKYPTVFVEQSRRHSQKPEYAYLMLEDMFKNASKLEMFARRTRQGWDCWGNEV